MVRAGNRVVTVLQHRLLHYRVDFFEKLRARCAEKGVTLRLVHGQASAREKARNDEGFLPWADAVQNIYLPVGGRDLLWQPLSQELHASDLIVLMQENRILSNYPYLFRLNRRGAKLAYWGHGLNFQSRAPNGLRERWKRALTCRVDWWFAYTAITVDALKEAGFPLDRITCLNNAVDTKTFSEQVLGVSGAQKEELLCELNIPEAAAVGIFCGSLYPDKRLDLMVRSAEVVRATLGEFHLIVIGDGPSGPALREQARTRPWLHMVGVKRGAEKSAMFSLAQVMLNPGLLGLHVLDSFSIGLPLISTTDAPHSPEVAYIDNGRNGELVNNDVESYSAAVIRVLSDREYNRKLCEGALASGKMYSLDAMVSNFADGILECLSREAIR